MWTDRLDRDVGYECVDRMFNRTLDRMFYGQVFPLSLLSLDFNLLLDVLVGLIVVMLLGLVMLAMAERRFFFGTFPAHFGVPIQGIPVWYNPSRSNSKRPAGAVGVRMLPDM